MQPSVGNIYQSSANPALAYYVEAVSPLGADGFMRIELCHPDDVGDKTAPGWELTSDEWQALCTEYGLTLQA